MMEYTVGRITQLTTNPELPIPKRIGHSKPFYINPNCEDCGTALVIADGWDDEFECPKCKNGIYLDWPEKKLNRLLNK